MSKFVIPLRVSLVFLGDKYKDDYLEFKSIPAVEQDKIITEAAKLETGNMSAGSKYLLKELKKYFIGGQFQGEKVDVEDLDILNSGMIRKCLEVACGNVDPN